MKRRRFWLAAADVLDVVLLAYAAWDTVRRSRKRRGGTTWS